MNDRVVFLTGAIDEQVANLIVAQLLHLDSDNPKKDIKLYINSPGGDMNALFAIYDTMQCVHADIETTCVGQAASAAAVLLAAGAPGKRNTLPHSRILIHQPHGGAQGQSVDIEIWAREVIVQRDHMVEILARHSGQTEERVRADIDRDYILRGDDAVAYGLVDHVIEARSLQPVAVSSNGSSADLRAASSGRLRSAVPLIRARLRFVSYGIATPPLGRRIWPVMKLDASDARYSTA